jgi:hypothetical protein
MNAYPWLQFLISAGTSIYTAAKADDNSAYKYQKEMRKYQKETEYQGVASAFESQKTELDLRNLVRGGRESTGARRLDIAKKKGMEGVRLKYHDTDKADYYNYWLSKSGKE